MTTTLIAATALAVALVTLLRDRHEHLKLQARDDLGVQFRTDRSPTSTKFGDGPMMRDYTVEVVAVGPGTYYNVKTHVWTGDHIEAKWRRKSVETGRFDSCSPPLRVELQMPVADADRTWFGISHVSADRTWPFGRRRVQSQYVRSLIGDRRSDGQVQVWRRYRTRRLRRWWQAQRWFTFAGGGQPRPLGCWKAVPLRELLPKQGPVWDGLPDPDSGA